MTCDIGCAPITSAVEAAARVADAISRWRARLSGKRSGYLADCALTLVAGGHVVATVERIEEELTIDGFVYRLNPRHLPGVTASAQH